MPAVLLPNGKQQFFTTPGVPAVGYKLATFAAGTSSNQTTWADALKVAANTNPIILDARGEAVIFWDGAYKVQLQDSTGAVIWTVDNVSSLVASLLANFALDTGAVNAYLAAGATAAYQAGLQVSVKIATTNTGASTLNYGGLGARNIFLDGHALSGGELQAGNIYALEYDGAVFQLLNSTNPTLIRTPAELAAGVVPVNLTIPSHLQTGNVFIVERYGNNTVPGTTDMSGAFTTAVKMAQRLGGVVTYGGQGPLMCLNPINCTFATGGNQKGIIIRGPDSTLDIFTLGPANALLIFKCATNTCFDCTGNDSILFDNVAFTTDNTTFPKVGIFTARNSTITHNFFRAFNTKIIGRFSVCCMYNYASENSIEAHCYYGNYSLAANTCTRYYTGSNIAAIASDFATDNFGNALTLASGTITTIEHSCFGCEDNNQAGTSTSDCVRIEQADSWKSYGGMMVCTRSGFSSGRSAVYVDMTNGPSNLGYIDGSTCDNSTFNMANFLQFSNHARIPSGWSLNNIRVISTTSAVTAGALVTVDSLQMRGVLEQANNGSFFPGTLQNSTISTYQKLTIGANNNNNLQGDATQWTITTSSGGSKLHMGARLTFAPGIVTGVNGWTLVGALTQSGFWTYLGNAVFFSIKLQGATSLACTNGATIPTLPAGAIVVDSACSVVDVTGHTIGGALIAGNTITMPAITTTADEIIISGTYFVS